MPPGNRLLALADREFRQVVQKPEPPPTRKSFKPVKLNPSRFDSAWDRKRGAAVRLTAVLLSEDDAALQQRVCEDERTAKTYADAASWLQRESAHLRRVARRPDTAAGRLSVVLERCTAGPGAPAQQP